jgi:hypothetical protein
MMITKIFAGALAGLAMTTAAAMAEPSLPACDSAEASTDVNVALTKTNAPFSITDYAGITTDRQSSNEIACMAIATLSNGSHRPVGYKFRIMNGKLQSWVGFFEMKPAK